MNRTALANSVCDMEYKKHYKKQTEKTYKCLQKNDDGEECGDILAVSKDTLWNLKRHISRKHASVLRQHENAKKARGEPEVTFVSAS